jgi:hypothetical protein
MKEMVLKMIQKSGERGVRLRDVGFALNVPHTHLLPVLEELCEEKKIFNKFGFSGSRRYIFYYAIKYKGE